MEFCNAWSSDVNIKFVQNPIIKCEDPGQNPDIGFHLSCMMSCSTMGV